MLIPSGSPYFFKGFCTDYPNLTPSHPTHHAMHRNTLNSEEVYVHLIVNYQYSLYKIISIITPIQNWQLSNKPTFVSLLVQIWTICIKELVFCFLNAVICGQQTLNKVNHNGTWWRQDQIMSSAHSRWERCIKWSSDRDPFCFAWHFVLV